MFFKYITTTQVVIALSFSLIPPRFAREKNSR